MHAHHNPTKPTKPIQPPPPPPRLWINAKTLEGVLDPLAILISLCVSLAAVGAGIYTVIKSKVFNVRVSAWVCGCWVCGVVCWVWGGWGAGWVGCGVVCWVWGEWDG